VIRACLQGKVKPLMESALFHEYEDLLERSELMDKSPISRKERLTLFEAFLTVADWIKLHFLWRPNLPDEADNHLIELALAGSATIIVTNNLKDLKNGELHFPSLSFQSPNQFLTSLP
jgi:uncharacterized protein